MQAAVWAVVLTVAAGAISFLVPGQAQLVVVIWAILVGIVALAYAAAVMLRGVPVRRTPRRDVSLPSLRALRYRPERQAAPGLREMERMVIFGQASAYDFESRLRPHLVAIASQRLNGRGLRLDSPPERVRALLGDDAWDLVRPDYEPVADRRRFGVPWAKLAAAVDALEKC